jgi:hypothetical protein
VEGLKIRPARRIRDRLQHAFSAYTAEYVAARVRDIEKV